MESIKIGGIDYAISYEELESDEGVQFGWCRFDKAKIEINNRLDKQKQEQTLIHEITHAIFHEAGLDEQALDESIVNPFSLMLHRVLQENDLSAIYQKGDEPNG